MLYDYYGFPPESYEITWPAPGAPDVARRVRELLTAAGIANAADHARGYDHGTFVPLKLTYPEADVPAIQLSLKTGLEPVEHIALGRALMPLRDEDIFIIANNHYRGQAAANALELAHALTGARKALPPGLLAAFPRLAAIAGGSSGDEGAPWRLPL